MRIPVNVVDNPELGSFIMPSIIDRSPVVAAVSTGGASRPWRRLIRLRVLDPQVPRRLAELASKFRDQVKQTFSNPAELSAGVSGIASCSGVAERLFRAHGRGRGSAGRDRGKASTIAGGLRDRCYLVGGGPGDPDLLTFRGLRLMQQAEGDRLRSSGCQGGARRDRRDATIYVGKERDRHAMRQEEIDPPSADLSKRVVRLKGGNPFIFGRGGEEIDTLAAEGIPFQVVPASPRRVSAYSGIPLTHRTMPVGHLRDRSPQRRQHQSELATAGPTESDRGFLHGSARSAGDLRAIDRPRRAGDMPAALVPNRAHAAGGGSIPAPWRTSSEIVEREQPKPPTLIIIGEVVELHEKLCLVQRPGPSEQGATSPIEPGSEL